MEQNAFDFGPNVKGELTIDEIKRGEPLYHRPKDAAGDDPYAVIRSLMKYGFSREYTGSNGGNMYGPGVYNVYSLGSSIHSASGYGRFIVKSYLLGGYQNFLIFNKDMAKRVYGSNWPIENQIRMLMPPKLAEAVIRSVRLYMNDNSTCNHIKTSVPAVAVTNYLGSRISQTKIRGIIYSGGHDGNCAFVRNFSEVVPYSYSTDNGKTWQVGISDELVWRAGHDTDVKANLQNARDEKGHKIFADTAERSINGYVITYNKDNKANYFEVAKNKLISDVWFDFASNFDENGEAEVLYKGKKLKISKYDDGNYVVTDFDGMPICYLNDLPDNINESIKLSEKDIRGLVVECVRHILKEGHESIDGEKVLLVKRFLDKNFKRGMFPTVGGNGFPTTSYVLSMVASDGSVLQTMDFEDALDLLIDRFKNIYMDKDHRDRFLKQVLKDWFNEKIGIFGNLSVNHL